MLALSNSLSGGGGAKVEQPSALNCAERARTASNCMVMTCAESVSAGRRTFPEGAGTVNSETGILPGLIFLLAVLRRFWARRDEALGSGIDPAGSTAKRPKVLDAKAGRRTLFRRRGKVGGSRVLGWCGSRCVLQRRWPGWWTGPGGLSVIPSPRGAAWSAATVDIVAGEVNQRGRPRRICWGS